MLDLRLFAQVSNFVRLNYTRNDYGQLRDAFTHNFENQLSFMWVLFAHSNTLNETHAEIVRFLAAQLLTPYLIHQALLVLEDLATILRDNGTNKQNVMENFLRENTSSKNSCLIAMNTAPPTFSYENEQTNAPTTNVTLRSNPSESDDQLRNQLSFFRSCMNSSSQEPVNEATQDNDEWEIIDYQNFKLRVRR